MYSMAMVIGDVNKSAQNELISEIGISPSLASYSSLLEIILVNLN